MLYLYHYVALFHLQMLHIKAHWTLFNINVYFNSTSHSANAQYVNVKRLDHISFTISFTFLEQELLHNDTCQPIGCINTRKEKFRYTTVLKHFNTKFYYTTVHMTVQLNLNQRGRNIRKKSEFYSTSPNQKIFEWNTRISV